MARVQLSALLNSISGNLSGSTFFRTRHGIVLSNRRHSSQSPRSHHFLKHASLIRVTSLWFSLSTSVRSQWTQFARFARVRSRPDSPGFLSARQLFVHVNYIRFYQGIPAITAPVFEAFQLASASISSLVTTATLVITFNRSFVAADEFPILYLSCIKNETSSPFRSTKHLMLLYPANSATFDITSSWSSVYGSLPSVGQFISYRLALASVTSGLIRELEISQIQLT
jgi:hypothetical protein